MICKAIEILMDFQVECGNKPSRRIVTDYVNRALDEKRIALLESDGNVSFGIARAVNDPKLLDIPALHQEGGKIVYIDFLYVAPGGDINFLKDRLLERFPMAEEFAFHRKAKKKSKLRTYKIETLNKFIQKIGG